MKVVERNLLMLFRAMSTTSQMWLIAKAVEMAEDLQENAISDADEDVLH